MVGSVSKSARPRSGTASSIQSATHSVKAAGTLLMDSDVPPGFFAATATATSTAPTLSDIRRGSYGSDGWDGRAQLANNGEEEQSQQTRGGRRPSSAVLGRQYRPPAAPPVLEERDDADTLNRGPHAIPSQDGTKSSIPIDISSREPSKKSLSDEISPTESSAPSVLPQPAQHRNTIPNGFVEPPKVPWTTSTAIALKSFWKWFITPFGFLMTIYGLNVVAWGGMLFLLLLGAAPAMCSQNLPENSFDGCNDINSPRRIWVEITSQILNGLFCVTGFGLIPWRFRDLYLNLRWRIKGDVTYLRRLAGINANWFRLPESDTLDTVPSSQYPSTTATAMTNGLGPTEAADPRLTDPRLPLPLSKMPSPPLTGVRARPSRLWLLDFTIWCNVWNTIFQGFLAGFMWGMNRYDRPPWTTGLFIALAFGVAGAGGITMFVQGKRVKRVEGVKPAGSAGEVETIGLEGGKGDVKR